MQRVRSQVTGLSTTNRSRVTNGTRLLDGIDGRSAIARRFRDILKGLLAEFDIATESDQTLVKQAAFLTILSEQFQTKVVNGEFVDVRTVTNFSGQLRRTLSELRQRNGQRGPAPPSIHEHLASYHETLDPDDDGDEA